MNENKLKIKRLRAQKHFNPYKEYISATYSGCKINRNFSKFTDDYENYAKYGVCVWVYGISAIISFN